MCVRQLLGAWGLTALRRLRRVFQLGSCLGFGFVLGLGAVGLAGLGIGNGAGLAGLLGLSLDAA